MVEAHGTRRCRRPSRTLRSGSMSKGHYAARGTHFRWQSPTPISLGPSILLLLASLLLAGRLHFGFFRRATVFLSLFLISLFSTPSLLRPPLLLHPPGEKRKRTKDTEKNHENQQLSSSFPFPFVFFSFSFFLSLFFLPSLRVADVVVVVARLIHCWLAGL